MGYPMGPSLQNRQPGRDVMYGTSQACRCISKKPTPPHLVFPYIKSQPDLSISRQWSHWIRRTANRSQQYKQLRDTTCNPACISDTPIGSPHFIKDKPSPWKAVAYDTRRRPGVRNQRDRPNKHPAPYPMSPTLWHLDTDEHPQHSR